MNFLSKKWKRQPTGLLALNEASPFVDANLIGLWTYNRGAFRPLVTRDRLIESTTGITNTEGIGFGQFNGRKCNAASSGNIQLGASTADFEFQFGGFSYTVLARQDNLGSTGMFFIGTRSSSSASGYDMLMNSGGVPGRIQIRHHNGVAVSQSATIDKNDNDWHLMTGGRSSADTMQFYIDRTLIDNTTAVASPEVAMTNSQALSLAKRGATFADCSIALAIVRKAEMPFSMQEALYDNPWQLFKQYKQRLYFAVTAAGFQPAWAVNANTSLAA